MSDRDYILGTHDEELERLGLQHRVWRPRVLDAWRRAGFTVGQTLIDVGCGPGYAAIDLAEIVGPRGTVIAIERSRRFLNFLEAACRLRGLAHIETHEADLDQPQLQIDLSRQADGAWCRWVLCFVKRPREVLERIASLLRPGGTLVLHEYFHYATWRLAPACPELEEFVGAVMRSWRAQGGEPDIALQLPQWLNELGFHVVSARPIVEAVHANDYLWQWPRTFIDVGLQRLVELQYFPQERAAHIRAVISAAEDRPETLMMTPGVLELIAARH